jgi:hypothetical protein
VSQVCDNRRPDIGQHTAEVLKEFKFSEKEIANFVKERTVITVLVNLFKTNQSYRRHNGMK